jgi:hypothetical protein
VRSIVGVASRYKNRHLQPFGRGGVVAAVETIAFLMIASGEVVEGEVEKVSVVGRALAQLF